MILRTVVCCVCDTRYSEEGEGDGFPNWGQIAGAALDGDVNPYVCPVCFNAIKDFITKLKEDHHHGVE